MNTTYQQTSYMTLGKKWKLLFILGTFIFFLCMHEATSAALYKWIDENGRVHYSDKIPPENVQKEHKQLNEQGVVVRSIDNVKTPEQLRAEKVRDEQIKREKERLKKKALHDRFLLENYKSKDEIIELRDEKIKVVDIMIDNISSSIEEQKKIHETLLKKAASYERNGKKVPEQLLKDIEKSIQLSERQAKMLESKKSEKTSLMNQYDSDIIRWLELKREIKASTAADIQ